MPEEVIMLEDLEGVIENKYLAVNVAARRARQLNQGDRPLVETNMVKPSTIALQELIQGKLEYRVRSLTPPPEELEEIDETLLDDEDEEPLLEEEYIDDTELSIDDEEPEEGL